MLRSPLSLALVAALASACPVPADRLDPPTDPALAQLVVTPPTVTFDIGATVDLEVQGLDSEGNEVDIAERLSFTSDDDAIATVDDDGLLTAISVGQVIVTARVGLIAREVPVEVVVAAPPDGLAYDSPVSVTAGAAMSPLAPTSTGGTILTYTAAGLPRGLAIDERTGVISGIPTVPQLLGDVVVTGTNGSGSATATLEIEVRCVREVAPSDDDDRPDPTFNDENADGVDGMACGPVFVSPDGDDNASGLRDAPLRTLGAALAMAASLEPVRDVYLAAGSYVGPIALSSGVSIYGGFDAASSFATRAAARTTRIAGGRIAITADALQDDVELGLLEIIADDALIAGAPSIGVLASDNVGLLTLTDVVVQAGAGGDGEDGASGGAQPGDAPDGASGGNGCEGSTFVGCAACTEPSPGPGVLTSVIGGNGGAGGAPGLGPLDGSDGLPGEAGAPGGLKGLYNATGDPFFLDGLDGTPGALGVEGADGLGGLADVDGEAGVDGGDGEGGGGGGGGAGYDSGCDDYGGAGGAGGAGARGGRAGRGGTRGGGSYGMVIVQSDVVIDGVQIVAGAGGAGGDGGAGALGGIGGDPGPGSLGFDTSGKGGAGGRGGDGGDGGHGGGGGGGSSMAILVDDDARLTVTASTLLTGQAGAGGAGPGNPGAQGLAQDQRVGTLTVP